MTEPVVRILIAASAIAAVGFIGIWVRALERRRVVEAPLDLTGIDARVILFTDAACRRCDLVRARLEDLAVTFVEIAHNHEPELQRAIGVTGVPLLVVRRVDGTVLARLGGVPSMRRLRKAVAA